MDRDRRGTEDFRREELEKEKENQERRRMEKRERGRADAYSNANDMFEERRRVHESAAENEQVRIDRLAAEHDEIVKLGLDRQIRRLEEQKQEWRKVNENLSTTEREKDCLSEEEQEKNLE